METTKIESALSPAEWAECVAIERSGNDPLTYSILANAAKAMCWINGNLPDADPRKFTQEDVEFLRIACYEITEEVEHANRLADHIATLLPPQDSKLR